MTEESEQEQAQTEERASQEHAEPPLTRGWGKQLMGAAIGMLAMAVALQIGASFGWQPANRMMTMLIGGAIGATLLTLDRFEQAGARLTRRAEGAGARIVNVLVGLLGLLVVTGLMWMLASSIGWLIDQF